MWDLPVYGLVFLLVAALKVYQSGGSRIRDLVLETASLALLMGVVIFLLYSPYFLTFASQVSGIGALDGPGTRPRSSAPSLGSVSRRGRTLRRHCLLAYDRLEGLVAHDSLRSIGGIPAMCSLGLSEFVRWRGSGECYRQAHSGPSPLHCSSQ